jgi:hypothetical protein
MQKGDTVSFAPNSSAPNREPIRLIGTVVRVRKSDGFVTVDVPDTDEYDGKYWDVHPSRILSS